MDDEIISITSIRYNLEDCISKTNITIQKWKTINRTSPSSILSEDAKSIILNLIRKKIVRDKIDFSRFRKIFRLTIGENKYINSITIYDKSLYYFRSDYIINELNKISLEISYKALEPKDEEVKEITNKKELISFKSIESIKF